MPSDVVAEIVAASRRAQGLPEKVEDPAALARVALILSAKGNLPVTDRLASLPSESSRLRAGGGEG